MTREFFRPDSVEQALEIKQSRKGSVFFAGGTEINRLNSSVESGDLISLERLNLKGVEKLDGFYRIGAMTTFSEALDAELPPFLKEALLFMGSFTKRNMATVGGNLALKRDDSYLVTALMASGAQIQWYDASGKHLAPMCDFLSKFDDGLITEIRIPESANVKVKRFAKTKESRAWVTVAAGKDSKWRLAAAIRGSGICCFPEAGAALGSREEFHEALAGRIDAVDDFDSTAAFKQYLVEEGLFECAKELR